MIIFLDFDGVLHPAPPHNRDTGVLCYIDRFESIMRDFPDWKIVISSSWREQFGLETMRGFFSEDIGSRISGTTPSVASGPFERQREIEQYLAGRCQSHVPWIALDDHAEGFAPELANLVLCDGKLGLEDRAEALFREKLSQATHRKTKEQS